MPPPPPPQQQPNLSISTSADDSIPPPPVSPLTPTLPPARLPDATSPQQPLPSPLARPCLTHSSHPAAVAAIAPPPPALLDFDSNPDVLALRSAISVLQVQKKRATADVHALSKARDAALDDPDAFVRDLVAGKVNAPRRRDGDGASKDWSSLPQPQDVVRCPPINWAQYAVVGSSLDKLHAEQVSRPTQGTPASVGADGTYEFRGDGRRDRYPGVAAPYAPTKDRIERKPKAKK